MASPPIRHLAIIGLGWHARRVYYPWIEQAVLEGRVRLTAVVDLIENEAAVRGFLADQRVAPDQLIFTAGGADSDRAPAEVAGRLEALQAAGQLDGVVISTDPMAHKRYVLWALSRDLPVLLDKPITAPAEAMRPARVADVLEADFEQIASALAASKARLVVQAQRRIHPGYRFIRDYLDEFLATYGVPVSFIDLYHADGMWVMPWEWDRDHHPYKYGTGKLLHSGYHFVDLCGWLLEGSDRLTGGPATLEYAVQSFDPEDFLALLEGQYGRLFGAEAGLMTPPPAGAEAGSRPGVAVEGHGEMDVTLLGRILSGGRTRTTVSLQLLQSSFSRRATPTPPVDPYKGAGRVRHERLNLQVGPLLNLQVHSYQSHEVRDRRVEVPYGPGHLDHFDVYLFRNADVVGGKPFEKLEFGRGEREGDPLEPDHAGPEVGHTLPARDRGHNEEARQALLAAFVDGRPTGSELLDHRRTTRWISSIYRALQRRRDGSLEACRMVWLDKPTPGA